MKTFSISFLSCANLWKERKEDKNNQMWRTMRVGRRAKREDFSLLYNSVCRSLDESFAFSSHVTLKSIPIKQLEQPGSHDNENICFDV